MQYTIRRIPNPITKTNGLYYAIPHSSGVIGVREIANRIADGSTLTVIDVVAVLEGFLMRLPDFLAKGYTVQLGDFGSMRLTFKSVGKESKKDVTANDIGSVRVLFRSASELKKTLEIKRNFELSELEKIQADKEDSTSSPPGSGGDETDF